MASLQFPPKSSLFLLGLLLAGATSFAQDTTKKKEINITSTFKPTLKEAAKINFNPTPPTADTTRPRLQYSIPNQNLSFAFQPGTLKPLALQADTGSLWKNESYVKIGYGNLKSPFAQAGLSFGDGRTNGFTAYVKHSASEGKIPLQDYRNSAVDLNGFFRSGNLEWNGRVGGFQEQYNKYGGTFRPAGEKDDSVELQYQTWRGRVSFRNLNRTELGLSYAPEIKIDVFSEKNDASESNTYVNVPLQKTIGTAFAVDVALTANLSRYKPEKGSAMANNFFTIAPSLFYKKSNINIQAGIRPSWDNGDFKVLPNVLAEFTAPGNSFSFQVGWSAYLRNSGYQYLAGMNPWIWAPATVYNTRVEERYAGFKGSLGDHFNYSAKVAFNQLNNQPLFVNDTVTGRSFLVVKESELKVFNIGGELGYTVGEKFSVISNLSLNQFRLKDNVKAWGLLPLEWKTNMRLQVLKDLYVNTTLYAFDGPWSLSKTGRKNLPAAMDLSAGLEFKIVKNVKLWAQFNNIFNKSYQRWNQYPVYGFNFLGGVVFSFAQKN